VVDGEASVCSNECVISGGRILAVDYGEKNIGLACSDELRLTVQPLPSFPNLGRKDLLKRLKAAIQSMDIRKILVGIPFNMDGTRGDPALYAEQLTDALKAALKIPVTGVDERLTTVEALELWKNMNPRRQKRYRTVDSLAAALILERFLKES
jgi:putative Holliday junction resolvase